MACDHETHEKDRPSGTFCRRTRREFLWEAGGAFTSVALAGLLGEGFFAGQSIAADGSTPFVNPLAPKPAPMMPKAKACIFLFMYGGPSHVDTFDYKPKLYPLDGKTIDVRTKGRGGEKNQGRVVGPKWAFKRYGECGKRVSDLFPNVGRCVDDIAFIHSMYADSPLHGSAMLMMNSGRILSGAPCLGSWVNYGLGSLNENLPGFVVMLDRTGGPISGAKNWSSGYMPATYQGVVLRPEGAPILDLELPDGMTRRLQRRLLDELRARNERHEATRRGNSELAARIASYELAYRMQQHAPEAVDVAREPAETRALYGIDRERTRDFGTKCLLARRLVERGVRFVQIYSGGHHDDNNWDAHGDLVKNHEYHAGNTDGPIAGLLRDLKRRGMLDETLVVWGGEFGRQPTAEYAEGTGRDHNSFGFTMWMAGGGIKGGVSVGATDELGSAAVDERFHVKNLHATILHQMGLDPNHLTYFKGGLDQKLVGVEGAEPIRAIINAMDQSIRVGAVQLRSGADEASNLERAEALVTQAAHDGATFVATPENTNFLGPPAAKARHATTLDGPVCTRFAALAARLGIHVLLGSFNERGPDAEHCFNTSVLLDPSGATIAWYRKIHLFDVALDPSVTFAESTHVAPGDKLVVVEMHGARVGLSICYDLRFPELYRELTQRGAEILTVPSAFTATTGRDHWDVLVWARAIENQCFVIAPAQWGRHDDGGIRESWGRTQIVDPWGEVLARLEEGEGVITADLDPARLDAVRRGMPVARHRRL